MRSPLTVCIVLCGARALTAQAVSLRDLDFTDSTAIVQAMPILAARLIALDSADRSPQGLDNLFRLQIVAGRDSEARQTLTTLHRALMVRPGATAADTALNVQYEVFAAARMSAAGSFADGFTQAFHQTFERLTDRVSALVIRTLPYQPADFAPAFRAAVAQARGKDSLSRNDARALVRAYQMKETYAQLAPLVQALVLEDDRRRYVLALNVPLRMTDGATVCAWIVRPRSAAAPRLPTLLEFTIYADSASVFGDLRRSASNGYAAVVGFTRGKECSPDRPVPYRYDGSDAAALIDWITRQSWSDGRVGMYGGSYLGFTQWATVKHMPKGLKAIMTGAANAPGIDTPMDGNVFWNFLYPWPFYTTDNKTLDNRTYLDTPRWNRLNREWYTSGKAYRDLDQIDGTPNPIFDEWVSHPSYDAYWQALIPYRDEFARVTIPVLQTAGYYYGGPGAAVYYVREHYRYNPNAEDYLVIGPYDHFQGQRGVVDALGDTATVLAGYGIDSVAKIDIVADLRYQWFDYVLRGGPKPALLQDRINYEVTGANVWTHSRSLAAMANSSTRWYLGTASPGAVLHLVVNHPPSGSAVSQTVDLADRSDIDRDLPGGGVSDSAVDTSNALEFVSDPLRRATEFSGLFSGQLDVVTNKRDFDFSVALYELTPEHRYLQLSSYWARASYVGDLTHRRLVPPGARTRISFTAVRLMSRRCQAGSRIVVVLGIIKNPGQEINYGSGKAVSDETIADAGSPLHVRWLSGSFIRLPTSR